MFVVLRWAITHKEYFDLVKDVDGVAIFFKTQEEAYNWAELNCVNYKVVEIE